MSYFEAKLSLTPSPSLRKSDIRDLDTKIDFKFSKVLCNYWGTNEVISDTRVVRSCNYFQGSNKESRNMN
jgi:hypothetical protein